MNLTHLQALVTLVDTGSFTEAGLELGSSQSAISHALAALEKELGVTLVERNRKGVVALTGSGQKVLLHARMLLTHAEAIVQEAQIARGEAQGKMRLGGVSAVCPDLLAGVLTHFQQQYPRIEVVLFEGNLAEVSEWIQKDIVDIGFVLHPTPGLESMPIVRDEMVAFVPEGHYFHRQGIATISELREEQFITPRNGCEFISYAGLGAGRSGPFIRYQAGDKATVLAMVREGLGVTVLPRHMLPRPLVGVVTVPLAPRKTIELGLAVKQKAALAANVRLFLQMVQQWVQANGGTEQHIS